MGKQRPRSRQVLTPAQERRMRQWRACGVLSLALLAVLAVLYVAVNLFRRDAAVEEHTHHPAPHGGIIASVGADERHYHVEAVADRGHMLKLYTYGEDLDELLKIDHQILTAEVKSEGGAAAVPLVLMPMPQPGDADGKTSRFFGKLPEQLRGKKLSVHVPGIDLAGRQFSFDFAIDASEAHRDGLPDHGDEEERLLLSAGGMYTEADIRASGGMAAFRKYEELQAGHDVRPRAGARLCPISLTKANRRFTWVVGGKTYVFCCPPCVEEFVRRAKEEPQTIKEPEMYVKK